MSTLPAVPPDIKAFQKWARLTVDGDFGKISQAVYAAEGWRAAGTAEPLAPRVADGELLFIRRPGRARTFTQTLDCTLYWVENGKLRQSVASTCPMQVTSTQSPRGHVAMVRPGEFTATPDSHKGVPCLRIKGVLPCWRNFDGFPCITKADRAASEGKQPGDYPQWGKDGAYADGVLFHASPPDGYSIACLTAPKAAVLGIAKSAWRVRVVDVPEPG